MKIFNSKMELPDCFTFVKVYYRQCEGWGLCREVGFWDGNSWNRMNYEGDSRFSNQKFKYVEGWEKIDF